MTKLHQLHEIGQSTWLNYMRRAFIRSGGLRERMTDGIQGITANAAAFEKTLTACSDYDEAVQHEMEAGTPVKQIHEVLMIDDVQRTADFLHPVYEATKALDGFASLELDPSVAIDPVKMVAETRHITRRLDRGNVMVEIPATPTGIETIKMLIGDGVCINATHIFSIDVYEKVARAYLDGLDYYFRTHSVWRIAPTAVASFSLSSIDHAFDPLLEERGRPDLKGKTAIAMAEVLYGRFRQIFAGPRWIKLANKGARVLRPKWTRTNPRNFELPATYYIDALIAPDTVMTFSQSTLNAFLKDGTVEPTLGQHFEESLAHLRTLATLGIDRKTVTEQLQAEYLVASDKQFQSTIQSVVNKRDAIELNWQPIELQMSELNSGVTKTMQKICKQRIMSRIWAHDATVWDEEDSDIGNGLNWLHLIEVMEDNINQINTFVNDVIVDGFTHVVLLGESEGSQAGAFFHRTFGKPSKPAYLPFKYLELIEFGLDTQPNQADIYLTKPENTLFILAAKRGLQDEEMATFHHLYSWVVSEVGTEAAGNHFVTITDPGSPLVGLADSYHFRRVFLNDAGVNGRFAALSYFGLLPAALVGTDITQLLTRTSAMVCNSETCYQAELGANLAVKLGAALGHCVQIGKQQLSIISSPALAGVDRWVGQLVEETLGLNSQFSVPESDTSISQHIFVHLRLSGDTTHDALVQELVSQGYPVIVLHWKELIDVGGHFFLWQMGTAVTAHLLQLNPFSNIANHAMLLKG